MTDGHKLSDIDAVETQEWLDALSSVISHEGIDRAEFLLQRLQEKLGGAGGAGARNTPYLNTIPASADANYPGDYDIEKRIRGLVRWNAMAMVVRGGKQDSSLGGHIGSFASSATLYDVGFNHFFRGASERHGGDLVYIQGHSSPGIYARSFLEGRLSEDQLENFRQEVDGKGLSSYPHSWLMPDYWQFATVSMGLGPIQAIFQARFLKYLHNRGLADTSDRKVWCFCGDGEMDEPESIGALSIAAREKLDNLIFVVNCNLQRLDGPVRGNSKIIQELESIFNGAGWNVIKAIWGRHWDKLFAKDTSGLLVKRMEECVDGDYQNFKAKDGAYTREHFFGKYPELLELVADMSDEEIWALNRGGHDPYKVYAAYQAAMEHQGQPTVILAKTVKGYGLGAAGQAQNVAHNLKKMSQGEIQEYCERFNVPVPDDHVQNVRFYRPAEDSPEAKYLKQQRQALGGDLPARRVDSDALTVPELDSFSALLAGSGEREMSTTMAFVRILTQLAKDKEIGKRIVPIVPDESRTFGMEGLFRQLGIYSAVGQQYTPVDRDQVMYYKEAIDGQILQEGLNEAGAFCSWIAAGTSYSNSDCPMIPFYIYYSMFGFQRVGDLAWAAGDMQTRGFLIGGTSGRTTLNGEGLQHEDGHSHVLAGTIPNCVTYDPTYAYELAVIIQDGLRRMYQEREFVFYYITTMNENYVQPAMPEGVEEGILKGIYCLSKSKAKSKLKVQLLGSGTILREVQAAQALLQEDFGVAADVWSVTSSNELARDGMEVVRWNRLHPEDTAKKAYITQCLENTEGPVIASTDYIKVYMEQLRAYIPRSYTVLGTDGFGRSDTRAKLRHFFEVDRYHVVVSALAALVEEGAIKPQRVAEAISKYGLDPEKSNPMRT